MKTSNTELFSKTPVTRAIVTLVIPTIISQIITVVYNMADTFFIGQTGDPNQVAAATLIMPPFLLLTGFANLFGIGGASLIARSLGAGDTDRARHCASFCIGTAAAVALIYGTLLFLLRGKVFPFFGADQYTYKYCCDYALWTIGIGAIPTVLSACLSHLVRSEGRSKQASFGIAMGGILNMALDPLLIFGFKMGVTGAAVATMLSNIAAMLYYIVLLYRSHGTTVVKFSFRTYTWGGGIPKEVILVGLPSSIMMVMSTCSNIILNKLVVSYSNQAIAGMGIAKKVDQFAFAAIYGMSQGVLPLIAYNYASGDHARMRSVIKRAFIYTICLVGACTLILFVFAAPIVRLFIDDAETVAYGQHFLKIICVTCPVVSVVMMVIACFQALGQKLKPMILSMMRKGCLDIPFMFIMNSSFGAQGIPWSAPIADCLAMIVALILFIPFMRRLKA